MEKSRLRGLLFFGGGGEAEGAKPHARSFAPRGREAKLPGPQGTKCPAGASPRPGAELSTRKTEPQRTSSGQRVTCGVAEGEAQARGEAQAPTKWALPAAVRFLKNLRNAEFSCILQASH